MLGGLLTGANLGGLGWRLIFLINIPLVVIALVGALLAVDESRKPTHETLDLPGMAVFALFVAALVVPLIQGRQAGWPWWSLACLAAAVPLFLALRWLERAALAAGRTPVLSPELFRDRNFRLGLLLIVVFFLGPPGFFLLTTLYLQAVIGFTAVAAGLVLVPFGATFVVTSSLIKPLVKRYGDGVIVMGAGIMLVGLLAFAGVVGWSGEALTAWRTALPTALIGAGQALFNTPLYEMLLRNVRKEVASTASAVFTTVQLVAQSLSVALLVIVFAAVADQRMAALMPERAVVLERTLGSQGVQGDRLGVAVEVWRTCARQNLVDVASGVAVARDEGDPAWREPVRQAADYITATVTRQAFVITLSVNLLAVLTSGLIMAAGLVKRRVTR